MHYYKFNISDWALATAHLSLEEEAIYFRLINHYYDTEEPIPLETQSVFRRLRLGSVSDMATAILEEFFEKTEKGFIQKKCDVLIKEYKKTVKKNKQNGSIGGRPKKNAASEETQWVSSGLPDETQKEPSRNPNYKPITNNQEPLTNLKDIGPTGDPQPQNQIAIIPDQPIEKVSRFKPPTQDEARDYFHNHGSTEVEADKFFSFYDSKGWKVGKSPMKKWESAATGWILRNKQEQENPKVYLTAREKSAARNAEIFDFEKATTF